MRFYAASKAIQLIGNRGVCPLGAIEGMMNALCTLLVYMAKADTEMLQAFDYVSFEEVEFRCNISSPPRSHMLTAACQKIWKWLRIVPERCSTMEWNCYS